MPKVKTVLIVDNQETNRILLRHILTGDYNTIEASNGQEGLDILTKRKIDVVVLGLLMPPIDNFEFLRRKKENSELAMIPILVTVASDKIDAGEKSLILGANDVINKPFEAVVLRQRLANLLLSEESSKDEYLVQYDNLTGVYSNETFLRKTKSFMQNNSETAFDIICINIKKFRLFNDLLGIEAGRQMLCFIAQHLYAFLHTKQVIFGRLDSDSFIVCARSTENIGCELLKIFKEHLHEYVVTIRAAVAIGIYHVDDINLPIQLMADRAHFAAYKDMDNYASTLSVYVEKDMICMLKEQSMVSEMHSALEHGDFKVYYQPKFNLTNNVLIGAEALVRWEHPTKGVIDPGNFISIFEKNGFITFLDEYVWEQVCMFINKAIRDGLQIVPISVNLSRVDIYKEGLCDRLCALRDKYSIPDNLLELEITESVYTENSKQLIAVVKQLKAAGFRIAMDDFGKGYSSLSMINEVAVDVLKLDMKFMENLETKNNGSNAFSFVVNLATWLDLPIIAEGIETETQVTFLRSLGCNMGQGYLLSHPQKAEAFTSILGNFAKQTFREKRSIPKKNGIVEEFWRHNSIASNIFNVFVGALALLEEHGKILSIIRANDKFNNIFGQAKLDLMFRNHNVLDGIHKDDLAGFIAMTKTAKVSKEEVAFDSRWNTLKKGKVVWLHSNMRAIYHDNQKTIYLCSIEDMTARKEEEIKNKINNRRLQMILAESKINVWEFDIASQTFLTNKAAMRRFGLGGEVKNIKDIAEAAGIIHPDDQKKVEEFYSKVSVGQLAIPLVVRVKPNREKQYIWLQFKYGIVKNDESEPIRAVGVVLDVSKQKEMEAKYNREVSYKRNEIKRCKAFYEVDLTTDRIVYTSSEPVCAHWNIEKNSYSEILSQVVETNVQGVFQQDLLYFTNTRDLIELYESGTLEVKKEYLRKDKEHEGSQWCRSRFSFVRNPTNQHITMFILVKNIHEEKLAAVKIKYAAEHDALTGAYNRGALRKVAKGKLEKLGENSNAAFVIFDLDKFKEVNDTYGHQKGDQVLCTLVQTIHKVFRSDDLVCRLGGDEFAVFLEGVGDEMLLLSKAREICRIISHEHWHLMTAPVTCSVGAAIAPQHGKTFDELYQHADEALYKIKDRGRNGYCLCGKEPITLS